MNASRPVLRIAAPLAALAMLMTGCAGAEAPQSSSGSEPVRGGTLVFGAGGPDLVCLDPVIGGFQAQAALGTQYLEQLFYQNAEGVILPWLASDWEWAEDGLSLEVTVRDDVVFSDGTPLNAETVVANVEYIKDPDTRAGTAGAALKNVTGAEIVDEDTARILLATPDNALLEHFAQPWVPIQSTAALARGPEQNCTEPIGTGPFKIETWEPQQRVVLVANEHHTTTLPDAGHTGAAYLDEIIWQFIPDTAARFAALQSGEVDVIDNLQAQHEVQIDSLTGIEAQQGARPGTAVYLALNTTKAPFDDQRVREAFIRSVDVDGALQSVFFGKYERTHSLLSTATAFAVQDPEAYRTDLDRAGALLDEAGWNERDADGYRTKDGERLSVPLLLNPNYDVSIAVAEQFQATAKEVGIEVLIQYEEWATFQQRVANWEHGAAVYGYTKNSPSILNIVLESDAGSGNIIGYEDAEFEATLERGIQTTDEAERAEAYQQVQQTVHEQHLVLPLFDRRTAIAYQSDVQGAVLLSPVTLTYLHDAWLDR